MAEITVWTTAEVEFSVTDESGQVPEGIFDDLKDAIVTLKQGSTLMERHMNQLSIDPEQGTVTIHLAQDETAKFKGGTQAAPRKIDVQLNLYYATDERDATYETQISVLRNLHARRMR